MEWYYADGTQQKGPVTQEELDGLVQAGTIQADTLVWREGMANWQPHGQLSAPPVGGVVCSQCGKPFPAEEVMRYGDSWVCGNCKPLVLQRLREGGPGLSSVAGTVSREELLARDYSVDAGDYLGRSWELFKANTGLMIGATVLVYLVLIAVNVIPYLGAILSLVFTGPVMAGLWLFYLKLVRGEEAVIGDAFKGFGPRFGQLTLGYIVSSILAGICMAPGIILVMVVVIGMAAAGGEPSWGAAPVVLIVAGGVLAAVGFAGFLYLTVGWIFTLPLIADKEMNFWPAMQLGRRVVLKHWWGTLWLLILVWLLAMLGALLCLVGLLVTGPVAMGMLTAHYQKVFGDLRSGLD
jgi:hypothetical protein